MKTYTFRLKPGQDLMDEIQAFVEEKKIEAGCVLSGVGSLTDVVMRLAGHHEFSHYKGTYEIVSMTGTVAVSGSHIHISFSDDDGVTLGGHLVSGCKIRTTAEIVLAAFEDVVYTRELLENDSGYEELVVREKTNPT
jgi:predicted DNA-binding protein with PD1-like motif